MKLNKLFAGVLAAAMMMSVGVSAMAADAPGSDFDVDMSYDGASVCVYKTYQLVAGADATVISPAETFEFTEVSLVGTKDTGTDYNPATQQLPTVGTVSYEKGEAGSATATKSIIIELPEYDAVGIYTYTFSEKDQKTAGVTYRESAIKLVVTVVEDEVTGKTRVAAVHTEGDKEEKSDLFNNTYSAGSLNVTKKVTGEFGDKKKEFNVKVTFKAPDSETVKSDISYVDGVEEKSIEAGDNGWTGEKEVTITLKNDETVTFTNIPYGVTYTVVEDDYTGSNGGYDAADYNFSDNNKKIDSAEDTVKITNNKGGNVDTGVILDNAPYILMLAVVAGGVFFMVAKKRREE